MRKLLIFLALLITTACSSGFIADRAEALRSAEYSSKFPTLTWYGVTTLLFDDGAAQVLFDGFFSRPGILQFKPVQPGFAEIDRMIGDGQLQRSGCTGPLRDCPRHLQSGLGLVIPFHAHVDHALDSAAVASLTGASLLADASVRRLAEATTRLGHPDTPMAALISYDDVATWPASQPFGFGDISVRLFRTPHLPNFLSGLTAGTTALDFVFPASPREMKLGRNYSALIEVGGTRVLVVASAGQIDTQFSDLGIEADLVLLGIGYSGWAGAETFRSLWTKTVIETGACQVALVHWDDGAGPVSSGSVLKPLKVLKIDTTWEWAKELAKDSGRNLIHLPVGKPIHLADLHHQRCRDP